MSLFHNRRHHNLPISPNCRLNGVDEVRAMFQANVLCCTSAYCNRIFHTPIVAKTGTVMPNSGRKTGKPTLIDSLSGTCTSYEWYVVFAWSFVVLEHGEVNVFELGEDGSGASDITCTITGLLSVLGNECVAGTSTTMALRFVLPLIVPRKVSTSDVLLSLQ